MFRIERYRSRTVVTSLLAGLVIAIPLCLLSVRSKCTGQSQSVTTEESIEQEETVAHMTPYYSYSFMTYVEDVPTEETSFSGYDFIPLSADMQVQIYAICEEYEISYDLILAVIKTESEFQWLIGDDGQAIGYMQIWPKWWQETADAAGLNINEPLDNVHLGIIILTDALDDNCGDLNKALKQYNSGNPHYHGNEYIDKVFENYEWIEGELNDADR